MSGLSIRSTAPQISPMAFLPTAYRSALSSRKNACLESCTTPHAMNSSAPRVVGELESTISRFASLRRHCSIRLSWLRALPTIFAKLQTTISIISLDSHFEPKRSEEHTSELQSQSNLVCRLLL